jgi:hypothetical protein
VSGFRTTRCRSCGGEIVWAQTERGKRAPIDAEPNPLGDVVLRARTEPTGQGWRDVEPLAIFGVPDEAFPDEPRHTSHFATCPDADRWRRRQQEGAA